MELTISEEGGGSEPVKRTVTAVVADGFNGFVREDAQIIRPDVTNVPRSVPLNFDAFPVILANGKIRLTCSIQYRTASGRGSQDRQIDIRQNLVLILENGKPLVVSDATDPVSDRRVSIEVKGTILK